MLFLSLPMEFIKAYMGAFLRTLGMRRLLAYFTVFAGSFVVHYIIQFTTNFFGDMNDSYYHAKLGLMADQGTFETFPWLYHTVLRDGFVDHHYLFHIMLYPFIKAGEFAAGMGWTQLPGIYFGSKIFVVLILALVTTACYGLMKQAKIPLPWFWTLFLFAMPYDFFFRMHMIRVQGVSLLVMLVGLLCLWKKWNAVLGLLCFLYVWLYGGFFFLPIFVLIYAVVTYVRDKEITWKPLAWAFGGMILGFLFHPYFPKNILFLYNQIFETGLGYQINVGGEWKPYDTWYLFQMGVVTFLLQGVTLAWVMLRGQKLSKKTLTLLLISLMFLLLTWKSKRFIEYWPVFATLFSAFAWKESFDEFPVRRGRILSFAFLGFGAYILIALYGYMGQTFVPVVNRYFDTLPASLGVIVGGGLLCAGTLGFFIYHLSVKAEERRWLMLFREFLLGGVMVLVVLYSVQSLSYVVRDIKQNPTYVNDAGNIIHCIQTYSEAGDIVMTDDWDIFPLFFFFNHYNNYIVGLDPVFMDKYDHELYQNFADITMGKISEGLSKQLREVYGASFVVVDSSHDAFKNNIIADGGLEEVCTNNNFTGYRVR